MKHTSHLSLLIILTVALSGCIQNFKRRDCPSINHPALKQWQPLVAGSTVVFTNTSGESAVYLLKSITPNEPYVAALDVNQSSLTTPICKMTSTQVFSADDGSHDIILNFEQRDFDGINPAQDELGVAIKTILPDTEPERRLSRTPSTNLLNPKNVFTLNEQRTEFFASRVLENGQTYSEVIVFTGSTFSPIPDFIEHALSGATMSRNAGLIQLSRHDGSVDTIVPRLEN